MTADHLPCPPSSRFKFPFLVGAVLPWVLATVVFLLPRIVPAQPEKPPEDPGPVESPSGALVEVRPVSGDAAIDSRLTRIMTSTGWFENPTVEVRDGVVFLDGRTTSERYRSWAGDLAGRTRDVVAVVNRIRVTEGPIWNFAPAIEEIRGSIRKAVRALPTIGLALIILLASLAAARTAAGGVRRVLARRLNPMILGVASRAVGLLTFLVGLYLVLHVAGLTRLAATVIGGTGIAGLVAGIAFRDILENYLASVLISLRNPFRLGDVVDIGGHLGVVQRVTSRGTVLMDMDGNHIQIPNATVYKSVIHNFTANPNRRDSFRVGIGYDSDIADAQRIALDVLEGHPAVLSAPEALVLADDLGPSAINLTFYYWYDGTVHNGLKIKSSLIRLVKTAFQDEGVSMPDEAREIVFPEGVPVRMKPDDGEGRPRAERPASSEKPRATAPAAPPFTSAEGETASEAESIRRQARHSRNPEESPDLLADDDAEPAS